jgi:16S rRNA (adenine1518-N6/adenine1519-N6)-dimethyltransferase
MSHEHEHQSASREHQAADQGHESASRGPQAAVRGDIATPSQTQQILRQYGFTFKKSLGQNFLIDQNILKKIVDAAGLTETSGVLEIGPGIGALTQKLAEKAGKVAAIEIDDRLLPILRDLFREQPHVEIIHGDVLELDIRAIAADKFAGCTSLHVVANLPYYVTTPILMALLEQKLPLRNIVVMVQKEVAERISAGPGGKDYGSLSIAVQYYCVPEMITIVPQTVFIPRPNVDSAVIRLTIRDEPPVRVRDEALFFRLVKAAFAHRRKTICNNLLAHFGKQDRARIDRALERCGIDPARRAESLSIGQFADLANALHETETDGRR